MTPTQTPGTAGSRAPVPPVGAHPGNVARSPARGAHASSTSRMVSGGGGKADGAPPVLRHLRMPDEPNLVEAAAEILQL